MLKAEQVEQAHAQFLATLEAGDKAFRELALLTPEVDEKKPGQKMFTPDMKDSAAHIARALKVARLDALVFAQSLMMYTEEAREAAMKAQFGEGAALPVEETPAPRDPGFKLVEADNGDKG